jgi:glycerol-3-phosphate dehydrogenase
MARIPSEIESTTFDVIVVGAGINGAGIARDAAMRGLRVLLLDKGDLSHGTTSWSTRLIHGGLRYLEYAEVGLVRESLREREILLRIAPHLVKPLPLLIPIYKSGQRSPLIIRAGMIAYDLLSFNKSLERHRMLSREETLRHAPGLESEGLLGAALYYDAQVEYAERLVLENALAAKLCGTMVLTYARVDKLIIEDRAVRGVLLTDLLEGVAYEARAGITINVSGPWVDEVLSARGSPSRRMIGGTRGSHLIVDRFPGAPPAALYVEAEADRRPFFIVPWNGVYLIGTTDLPFDGDLDVLEAAPAEIDYLIRETNRVIPEARLARDKILYTYTGVRPLPFQSGRVDAGITRRHFIHDHAKELEGLLSIVGGKLTTYRSLAEQTVNLVFKKLGKGSPACRTAHVHLPGARVEDFTRFAEEFKAASSLPVAVSERLLRIYGARANEIIELTARDDALKETFSPLTGAIAAEILFSFQSEMAHTLSDCLLRRTMVGLDAAAGLDAVDAAARVAMNYLDWDETRSRREIEDYKNYLQRFHPREMARIRNGLQPSE